MHIDGELALCEVGGGSRRISAKYPLAIVMVDVKS